MRSFRSVSRTFGMAAACIALVACFPEQMDIGDARTGAELAPSLSALREMAPDYHRRLADGTFDSLSLVEQWDFLVEVRELSTRQREAERAEYRAKQRGLTAKFIDSIEAMPPDYAEESLALWRERLLRELKHESDLVRMDNWASGLTRPPSGKDAPR